MEKSAEKESSRRSWPWKKKSHDKISAAPDLGPSPVASKSYDNHQIWECLQTDVPSHQRQPSPMKVSALQDRNRMAVDEVKANWLQSEERAKILSEKLSNALADISSKDNLVKQHVKVAEEAVSGWEKAESEAVSLKAQLDAALQQKLATEDRVAHLDGALKECMKQLRHLREENEQRIHDTLLKKTREYEKLRSEMEARLADSSQFLAQTRSELLEARAEVTALGHALQERSRSVAETSEAKGRADTEIKVLQVRLETLEKENSQLKYEVHVLNKELDIRSQEREYERKAVDMASKQHLESVKKIAKLEEECNRLRLLVRKKLPGPGAIQRMRMEVEGVARDPADRRRRSMSRSGSQLDLLAGNGAIQDDGQDGRTQEAQMLAERVVAMDEEMKMLKEALAQRNGELQSARLLCSKTSTQLSVVEEELKRAKEQNEAFKNSSSRANNCSQEFTSKINDLLVDKPKESAKARDSQNFELMDDFAEMERLAMSVSLTEPQNAMSTTPNKVVKDMEEALASKARELDAKTQDLRVADQMCQELRAKLKEADKELTALRSQNATNEASMVSLREQLNLLSQRERRRSGSQSNRLSAYSLKDIVSKAMISDDARTTSEASSFEGAMFEEQSSISDAESKASTAYMEVSIALRKIVHVVEMVAQTIGYDYTPSLKGVSKSTTNEIKLHLDWKNHDLNVTMRNLANVGNKLLQGKSDVIDFLVEVGVVLEYILALNPLKSISGERTDISRVSVNKDPKSMRDQGANLNLEIDRLRAEKADISSQLDKAVEQVESLKMQLQADKQLLKREGLQHQNGGDFSIIKSKEDDMIEEELMSLSNSNPAFRDVNGELARLRDRIVDLERELLGELQRNQSVGAKLGNVQHPVQRKGNAISREMSSGSHGDLSSHSTSEEDEDTKSEKLLISHSIKHERQERDAQAAALAECQRTILALGKQIKGFGTVSHDQDERETSPQSTQPSRAIEKATDTMAQRPWLTEAAENAQSPSSDPTNATELTTAGLREHTNQWVGPRPLQAVSSPSSGAIRSSNSGVTYPPSVRASDVSLCIRGEQNGNGLDVEARQSALRIPSPAQSEIYIPGPGSMPGSPSRSTATPSWTLRNRPRDANSEAQGDSDASAEKMREISSFSRFSSRSRSGSITGSFG